MNATDQKYTRFALCRGMIDTVGVVRNFDARQADETADRIGSVGRLLLTGEGSSRIFPAKNARRKVLTWGTKLQIATDGGRQAAQYDLSDWAVFGASNSGRTSEVVSLMRKLEEAGHKDRYGLTANADTVLEKATDKTFVLTCGWEQAVAATKSVAEQALFYQAILSRIEGRNMAAEMDGLGERIQDALELPIDPEIVRAAVEAPTVFFAGYNDGVAEELTLKTNEITHKKSDFLEGTYAVHGIEEVMSPKDVVFVVDPIPDDVEKFREVLVDGVGCTVVAIANRDTALTTLKVPSAGEMTPYVYLAAGWNLLVEIGLALEIDLDKAERARKVGHEFTG